MNIILILASFLVLASAAAPAQADKITGYWLTEGGESQIRIYRATNVKYYGKIEWLDEPYENGKPKLDDENPDPALQNRPILGLRLLNGF